MKDFNDIGLGKYVKINVTGTYDDVRRKAIYVSRRMNLKVGYIFIPGTGLDGHGHVEFFWHDYLNEIEVNYVLNLASISSVVEFGDHHFEDRLTDVYARRWKFIVCILRRYGWLE